MILILQGSDLGPILYLQCRVNLQMIDNIKRCFEDDTVVMTSLQDPQQKQGILKHQIQQTSLSLFEERFPTVIVKYPSGAIKEAKYLGLHLDMPLGLAKYT